MFSRACAVKLFANLASALSPPPGAPPAAGVPPEAAAVPAPMKLDFSLEPEMMVAYFAFRSRRLIPSSRVDHSSAPRRTGFASSACSRTPERISARPKSSDASSQACWNHSTSTGENVGRPALPVFRPSMMPESVFWTRPGSTPYCLKICWMSAVASSISACIRCSGVTS